MKLTEEWNQLINRINEIKSENTETELSDNLLELLVVGEDHRFWSHFGVDPIGLVRAFWRTTFCNRREGGSTIAMQLVRTLTRRYEISAQRKLKEIYFATRLTLILERKEILKLYLNVAYFGWNMHGIKQTCKALTLETGSLSDDEAAGIIARLKYPEPKFNKDKKLKAINLRVNYIINRKNQLNSKERYGTV
jgi:penicillin-binding protein 1A